MRTSAKYYGTHDWIAERALYLAYNKYPENKFLSMLYLDVSLLKMYYLLGTEVPDGILAQIGVWRDGDVILNTGLNVITREDFQGCLGRHILRFDPILGESEPITWNLATFAENCERKISEYLQQGDCKAAALFLGAVAHYVGDAGCIPHLMDGITHSSWEPSVCGLTSRKISDEYYSDGEKTTEDPFYTWQDLAGYEFNRISASYGAKQATWYAGHATYNGETKDALQMETWEEFNMDYKNYSVLSFPSHHFIITDVEKRGDYWLDLEGTDLNFLGGVSYHLNIAVFYMASILANVKDWYVKCTGVIADELTQVIMNMGLESLLLWLFVATGNAATILALISTLSDKKEALVAPLQKIT